MLADGIQLLNTSKAVNFIVDSGTAFPTDTNTVGELFYKTSATVGLYVYNGSTWDAAGGGGGGGSPTLTTGQIAYGGASNTQTSSASLQWDNTNNYLILGPNTVQTTSAQIRSQGNPIIIRSIKSGTGSGPSVTLYADDGGATNASAGGNISITGGASNAASGAGGSVQITGGASNNVGSVGAGGAVTISAGTNFGSTTGGGAVTINAGDSSGAAGGGGPGGAMTLRAGNASGAGGGGNVTIAGGTSGSGTAGYLVFQTAGTERFRIGANGAWSLATAAGNSGQVLTSTGSTSAPTWQNAPASANIAGGAANQIPYQTGAGATAFSANFTYNPTTFTLAVGQSANSTATNITNVAGTSSPGLNIFTVQNSAAVGGALSLYTAANTTGGSTTGAVVLKSGNSTIAASSGTVTISTGDTASSGVPGTLTIKAGDNTNTNVGTAAGQVVISGGNTTAINAGTGTSFGGAVTVNAGDATATGPAGIGGALTLRGGNSNGNAGGSVTLQGGNSYNTGSSGNGGNVTLVGGITTANSVASGSIIFQAGNMTGSATPITRWTLGNTGTLTANSGRLVLRVQTPAFAASLTLDAATGDVFHVGTLTANITAFTINNPVAGQTVTVRFKQDGTGGRTIAAPSGSKIAGVYGQAANQASILTLMYVTSDARYEGAWTALPV